MDNICPCFIFWQNGRVILYSYLYYYDLLDFCENFFLDLNFFDKRCSKIMYCSHNLFSNLVVYLQFNEKSYICFSNDFLSDLILKINNWSKGRNQNNSFVRTHLIITHHFGEIWDLASEAWTNIYFFSSRLFFFIWIRGRFAPSC